MIKDISERVAEFCEAREGLATYHQLAMRQQEIMLNTLARGDPLEPGIIKNAWEKTLDEIIVAEQRAEQARHSY